MIFATSEWNLYYYFQMQGPVSCGEIKQEGSVKIYFPEKVFGKPTKNRRQDPSMFDLLAWGSDGFERHAFKKDERITETTQAYVNMIGKNPWMSQAQENYVDYHGHCIEANGEVLEKIQNYISERTPQSPKPQAKSASKPKKADHKKDDKKQNCYNLDNYLSPKYKKKGVDSCMESTKILKASSGEKKPLKKITMTAQHRAEKATNKYQEEHKKYVNKSYNQILEKTKMQDHEFTEGQQQKLIQKFKQTTRWIPNSAFTTYFGKPPFENYGRGNTNPVDGGLIYGTYLYSHNVHPHRGNNQPKNMQTYSVALSKAKSQGTLVPSYPRTKADASSVIGAGDVSPKGKIEPEVNNFVGALDISTPKLSEMQKFGGKRRSRVTTDY